MEQPIEKMSLHDLQKLWQQELDGLQPQAIERDQHNPHWEWRPIQERLERLHALAHEIHRKKALERAKWQP